MNRFKFLKVKGVIRHEKNHQTARFGLRQLRREN